MKICFWGNVARALDGKTDGGGELQIAFIARALQSSGHEIVVVDYNTKTSYITTDGIKVYPIKGWHKGIRVLRTITHRLPGLYSTLKEQHADIYYCRIRDFRHIIAYVVAKKVKGKFILHMASDLDAMSFRQRLKNYYFAKSANLWWFFSGLLVELTYPFLLRKADSVLVQHSGQRDILLRKNIKPVVFFNLIDTSKLPLPTGRQDHFIYVGWLDKRKGFPEFFNLVEKSPQHKFRVIGPPRDETGELYFNRLKGFKNVTLMGALTHSQTLLEISGSKALVSTSPMEGFPNVFIEAWAYGIPVISLTVDPGSVIEKEQLGVIAHGDMDMMLRAMDDFKESSSFKARAIEYIERNHALNANKTEEINMLFTAIRDGKGTFQKTVLQAVGDRIR